MRRYYKKHGLSLCLFAAANILAAVSSVFLSYLMGTFVDVAMEGRYRQVVALAVGTLAYIAGNTVLDFWMQQSRDTVVHRIGRELRADVVYKIEALPWETRRTTDDGQYISMVNNDVGTVEREYLDSIGMIFFQICCFTLAVASSVAIQPVMTLIMLAISALPVIFPKLTEKTLQQGKEEEQRAKARFLTVLGQVLGGFSQLKLFHRFGGINRSFDRANEELCGKSVRFSKLRNMLYSGAYGCGNLVYLGAWVIGLFFVFLGQLTLPLLVTFTQLMTFVAGPVQIISERYSALTAARAVCKRVLGFLDAPIDEPSGWGAQPLEEIREVALHGVSYTAGDRALLRDVDLNLRKGDRVALLGESGSGKSTLLKLLAALYTAGQGSYTINAREYRDYKMEDFREKVVLLEQKTFVFDASIGDNVTLFDGADSLRLQDAVSALENAGLGKWYEQRGANLDVPVGRENQAMSGGEERRLDLARVLYRNARFVMMDEPTTGLDAESRAAVERTIQGLDCDILIVAMHEYSPEFLAHFNRVIRMEGGQTKPAAERRAENPVGDVPNP